MEATPDLQVYDLGHFGHYWEGKPTEWLLGKGVTPGLLNDDRMGRMLDSLYEAGVTELFLEVANRARQAFPFPVRALHVNTTSFHVHGRYEDGEEGGAIRLVRGYSRDHRPDLKQWVMGLVCADTGGIPLLFSPEDGNASDAKTLVTLVSRFREALDLGEVVVLDGASYSQENLGAPQGFSWVMRVPATLKEAKVLLREELPQEAWRPLLPGYRGLEVESEYGGVRQRWLLVESQERARMEEASLQQRIARAEGEAQRVLGQLTARTFACEADARRALSEASGRLPLHRLVYLGVQEGRQWEQVGRPRKGERPLAVVYRPRARLEVDQEKLERVRRGLGRFLLATDALDRERLPPQEAGGDGVQPAGPEGETHSQAHLALGVSTVHVGSPGGAGGQVARPQPGSPSRDRGAPPGGRAILPAGVKGVRNVGSDKDVPGVE